MIFVFLVLPGYYLYKLDIKMEKGTIPEELQLLGAYLSIIRFQFEYGNICLSGKSPLVLWNVWLHYFIGQFTVTNLAIYTFNLFSSPFSLIATSASHVTLSPSSITIYLVSFPAISIFKDASPRTGNYFYYLVQDKGTKAVVTAAYTFTRDRPSAISWRWTI